MESISQTEWEILDATADDVENLEQIFRIISRQSSTTTLTEVADAVHALVQKGLLVARMDENGYPLSALDDLSYVWRAWFAMTPPGREVWSSCAPSQASVPTIPPGRIYFGAWKDLGVSDISAEEIAEARREMWGNFPRDFPE
jgi:hypothetical protein